MGDKNILSPLHHCPNFEWGMIFLDPLIEKWGDAGTTAPARMAMRLPTTRGALPKKWQATGKPKKQQKMPSS